MAEALAWRTLLALVALPGMVAVVVPLLLARRYDRVPSMPADATGWLVLATGAVCLAVGGTLFVACARDFVRRGRGTLAPWDPPRHLVISSPYRRVRNPMITGVFLVLLGEAAVLCSLPHLLWAGAFALATAAAAIFRSCARCSSRPRSGGPERGARPPPTELAIAVRAPSRRQGVGEALLRALLAHAAAQGIRELSLSVEPDNRLILRGMERGWIRHSSV